MDTLPRSDVPSPLGANLRRCAPVNSSSLPALKRQKIKHDSNNTKEGASEQDLNHRSSPESGSDRSGLKWFDTANTYVSKIHRPAPQYDNEPPFFMTNQIAHETHVRESDGSEGLFGVLPRNDSEMEDLRGVIDDLTIENKRLKHILRMQKARRPSSQHGAEGGDKLFEVRIHGLDPEKKRVLETLLEDFTSSIHTTGGIAAGRNVPQRPVMQGGDSVLSKALGLPAKRPQTDSGYVSNSNSGLVSAAPSSDGRRALPVSESARDKSVKTYLHEMPDTLLPRRNLVMSESSKMRLVVCRLEQLFTGKMAAPGEHSQPVQQQEVSHSAAMADRREDLKNNKRRLAEGSREAHIVPHDSKISFDIRDLSGAEPEKRQLRTVRSGGSDMSATDKIESTISRPVSPDQRPTRPLDLDIERQVVPSDNLDYIRHLGLPSPGLHHNDSGEAPWLYLNLLIGLAQLHTINVTPDFIRGAINKLSTKFELSEDGQRVRWTGGPEGTAFSKSDERAFEVAIDTTLTDSTEDVGVGGDKNKRSKAASSSSPFLSEAASNAITSGKRTGEGRKQHSTPLPANKVPLSALASRIRAPSSFDYKPLFHPVRRSCSAKGSNVGSNSSDNDLSAGSNDFSQALGRSSLSQRYVHENWITFYDNPYFCSDLSGDKLPRSTESGVPHRSHGVLGISPDCEAGESPLRYHDACYFTPQFADRCLDISDEPELVFTPQPIASAGEDETRPMELPVSGLGGVTPQDNFAVDVKIERGRCTAPNQYPVKKRPLTGSLTSTRYGYRVVCSNRLDLCPTPLPAPSYIIFTSGLSSDAPDMMDVSDESESSSSANEDHPALPALRRYHSTDTWQHTSSGANTMADQVEDDDSIDMLAAARAAHPEIIAAQEREYILHQSLAPDAIAPSLAATLGAGSCRTSSVSEKASFEDEDGDGHSSDVDDSGTEFSRDE